MCSATACPEASPPEPRTTCHAHILEMVSELRSLSACNAAKNNKMIEESQQNGTCHMVFFGLRTAEVILDWYRVKDSRSMLRSVTALAARTYIPKEIIEKDSNNFPRITDRGLSRLAMKKGNLSEVIPRTKPSNQTITCHLRFGEQKLMLRFIPGINLNQQIFFGKCLPISLYKKQNDTRVK